VDDEVQVTGDDVEVLAVPGRAGDLAAVQVGPRRCRRFQDAQRSDVDPENGPADGVLTQVVGQRFDLG
jgi:hypothetical protein